MRRRFNFTGRKRIRHEDVIITLAELEGAFKFYASLSLLEYQLPEDAAVWVEAYDRNAFMRFDFGSVRNPKANGSTYLSSFSDIDNVHFRVKVTAADGSGRLLALAKSINPTSQHESEESRRSILRVSYEDLEGRPWKLDILDSEYPILVLDKSIEYGNMLVRSDKMFFALVFPAIVESVLTRILITNNYVPGSSTDEADEWMESWIAFALGSPGVPRLDFSENPDDESKREWIEQAIAAFCRSHGAIRKLRSSIEERQQ